jgi:hypothetical protein
MWISIGIVMMSCGIHIMIISLTSQNDHSQIGHWII